QRQHRRRSHREPEAAAAGASIMTGSGISTLFAPVPEEATYLLCSEAMEPATDEAIYNYVRDAAHIKAWWNYIPGVFILRTARPLQQLQSDFYPFFAGKKFLLISVNPFQTAGWLTRSAWDWLNTGGEGAPPTNALAALTKDRGIR